MEKNPFLSDDHDLKIPRDLAEKDEISFIDYRLIQKNKKSKFGEGGNGYIKKGEISGTKVALKKLIFEKLLKDVPSEIAQQKMEHHIRLFEKEQKIVRSLKNPYICLYMGWSKDKKNRLVLVSELMESDLNKYIQRNQKDPPSLFQRMKMAYYICCGLGWVSKAGIKHFDLKPSNILMSSLDGQKWASGSICKITDFGCSIFDEYGTSPGGTAFYRSPECMRGEIVTDSSADVYSFGWILLNLVCWKTETELFRKKRKLRENKEEMLKFLSDKKEITNFVNMSTQKLQDVPQCIIDLILSCLNNVAVLRIGFEQILQRFNDFILIGSAIPKENCEAYEFWKNWFFDGNKFVGRVSWNVFNQAAALECSDPIFYDKNIYTLKEMFVEEKSEEVTIERFGKITGWLGPFNFPTFIERMIDLNNSEWFYNTSKEKAAQFLTEKKGTGWFLVRFSGRVFGQFALSKIQANKSVVHHTVYHKPNELKGFRIQGSEQEFDTLNELIQDFMKDKEKKPLDGLPRRVSNGHVNDFGYVSLTKSSEEDIEVDIYEYFDLQNCPIDVRFFENDIIPLEDFFNYVNEHTKYKLEGDSLGEERVPKSSLSVRVKKLFPTNCGILDNKKQFNIAQKIGEDPLEVLLECVSVSVFNVSMPKFIKIQREKCVNWLLKNQDFLVSKNDERKISDFMEDKDVSWEKYCEKFKGYSIPSIPFLFAISQVFGIHLLITTDCKKEFVLYIQNPSAARYVFLVLGEGVYYRAIVRTSLQI